MGQSPDSINYTDNSDDTVLIQGNADLNNGIVVPRIWSSQITKKSYPNDIIFTVRAPVGEIARNPYFATIGRGVASFKGNDFLYQSLIQKKENNYWNNISAGSTFDSINSDQLKNVIIYLPKNNLEQEKIGELFTNLDNLITLHQRKFNDILVYKLRKKILFLKFTKNVWEQRKLEEISNRFDNLRVPVSANEREKGTTPYYGANGIQDYVKGFTHNGEYVLIAEDGANDLKNYPVKYVNGLFWANNHVHVVQGKEGICDNKYLKYCFTKTNIESLLVGGGRAKLNANIMMGIELTVPSLNEQVELGRMFYELDNLITLHHRKYTYIFYSWEQRKVTDIGKLSIGLVTTMTSHYTDKGTLLIRNSDIKDNHFEFGEEPIYLDEEFANKNANRKHEIGDVITVHTGDVGTSAVIDKNTDKSIGFATIITRPNLKIIDSYYLSTFLNTEKHKKWAISISTGDGRTNYNLGDYQKLVVPLTSVDEQRKIARFILNIDNLITLHQHKELKRRNDNNEHLRW